MTQQQTKLQQNSHASLRHLLQSTHKGIQRVGTIKSVLRLPHSNQNIKKSTPIKAVNVFLKNNKKVKNEERNDADLGGGGVAATDPFFVGGGLLHLELHRSPSLEIAGGRREGTKVGRRGRRGEIGCEAGAK